MIASNTGKKRNKEIRISKVKFHSTDLPVFFLLGIWNFIQIDCQSNEWICKKKIMNMMMFGIALKSGIEYERKILDICNGK